VDLLFRIAFLRRRKYDRSTKENKIKESHGVSFEVYTENDILNDETFHPSMYTLIIDYPGKSLATNASLYATAGTEKY
jgi:hypothetical protein